MPPSDDIIARQTQQIISCLFEDLSTTCRSADGGQIESDSVVDGFDPVLIADRLRAVADAMNEDPKFKAALREMQQVAGQEVGDAIFSQSVDALCNAQVSKGAEVAPEMQLIRACVALGIYLKNSCPNLNIQTTMTGFITRRVGPWISKQGGWDKLTNI